MQAVPIVALVFSPGQFCASIDCREMTVLGVHGIRRPLVPCIFPGCQHLYGLPVFPKNGCDIRAMRTTLAACLELMIRHVCV